MRRARAPRPGLARAARRRRRRARHPAPARDRPRDRRPADLQRGPLGRRRPQRRDLQLPRAARATCSAAATRFATQGDTEVIAHLYEEEGPRLRASACTGCSASRCGTRGAGGCCWRATASARSRSTTPSATAALSFASELAALLEDPDVPRDVDHRALDAFLAYRWVPAPMTAFRAVRKLPPGQHAGLRGRARDRCARYWRLDFARKRAVGDPREIHEELREHIRAATAPPDDLRRAAGRLPLRRRRLRRRRGRDGRGVVAAGADLLDRLHAREVRRAAARAPGRRALRHRPPRAGRRADGRSS